MSSDNFENFDAFEMDDVDPDRPGSFGGKEMLPEGGYCIMVTAVVVQNEKGSTQIECEVLHAKDAALIGRTHTEYLNWPDGDHTADYNRIKKEQLLAWCYAAKTTSAEEVKQLQQARKGFNPDWLNAMVGRKCLIFVKIDKWVDKNTGADKTAAKVEGRVWAMDNPKGKGIPGWIGSDPNTQRRVIPSDPPSPPAATPDNAFEGLV